MKKIALTIALASTIAGCATKHYGRQGELTSYEKETMTCREIDLELAKTRGFVERVNQESRFSGRDVLAILGDFGIGNSMERNAALKSAKARTKQLEITRSGKECAQNGA